MLILPYCPYIFFLFSFQVCFAQCNLSSAEGVRRQNHPSVVHIATMPTKHSWTLCFHDVLDTHYRLSWILKVSLIVIMLGHCSGYLFMGPGPYRRPPSQKPQKPPKPPARCDLGECLTFITKSK